METVSVSSVGELKAFLAQLPADVLFRGQNSHYLEDGIPSVVTSFDRKGCIPSQMVKWARYASNVLDTYIGPVSDTLAFNQALLQHYGWRSFYVDCSARASVAAWFASHTFSQKNVIELCEDCDELSIMMIKIRADYKFNDGKGHMYVLDKSAAKKLGLVDLSVLKLEGARLRTDVQSAWLIGPIRNTKLPPECFIAHIIADRSVFRDLAAGDGLSATEDLFPSASVDPILATLLSLPRKRVKHDGDGPKMPFFRRALELPEYEDSFVKISSTRVAYFNGDRVSEREKIEGVNARGVSIMVPEIALFGVADKAPLVFPNIKNLLNQHGAAVFEIDDIIQYAVSQDSIQYQKGVVVQMRGEDLVELSELIVEHPGLEMTAVGISRGWYYRFGENDLWVRERHPEECPCGNEAHHLRHISALHIIEEYLKDPESFN